MPRNLDVLQNGVELVRDFPDACFIEAFAAICKTVEPVNGLAAPQPQFTPLL
jgi:hypothetical protein